MDPSIACTREPRWVCKHNDDVRKAHDDFFLHESSDILLLGDSIMSHLYRYPEIEKQFFNSKILNLCSPGDKIQNLIWKIQNNIIPRHVRKIIIHIGTNNIQKSTAYKIADAILLLLHLVTIHKGS